MTAQLSKRQTQLFLAALLLIAFALRSWQLEQFPAGLHFDEAANAILSSEIAFDGYRPVFISSYTGKETLFFYAAGLVMNRIGASVFALRLTAAFMGLITVAATYRLGVAILGSKRDALIAAFLLTFNFSHLLFSRLGFRAISQPLMHGLTVLFLIEGMRHLRKGETSWTLFGAAGLCLGLTAHTYLAARLFPIALGLPLAIHFVRWVRIRPGSEQISTFLKHSLLSLGMAILALAPLLTWFYTHPEAFWVRIEQVGDTTAGITYAQGLLRAASMLFLSGDPYIRFNIPGQPIYPLLFVILAFNGVRLLWREGEKVPNEKSLGRLILFIAPLVMLLPSALATSEIVPSNLRAIGIYPFFVFWIALGLGWLVDLVTIAAKQKKQPQVTFAAIVLFLFTINIFADAINYFRVWGPSEAAFYETEGDVQAVATYLNELNTDRPVFVSTRFVPHPTLAFLADGYDQLPLIPESRVLVYPAGERPFIVFPASSPEPAWLANLPGERETFQNENQIPTFSTFAPQGDFPTPQQAAYGNFGFALQLTGYDIEPSAAGQSLIIRSYNRVLGNPGFNMIPFVHLEDHLGNRWQQLEQPGYSPSDWQAGDLFVQQFELPLLAGIPPTDDYTIRLGWFDGDTGQEVTRFDENGQFAGSAQLISNVAVLPGGSATLERFPSDFIRVAVGEWLMLQGVQISDQRTYFQGDQLDFALWWQAERKLDKRRLVTQLVQNETIIEIENVDPAGNRYPFDQWVPPVAIIDWHKVRIPADTPPGQWELRVLTLGEGGPTVELFSTRLTIEPLDLILQAPAVQQPSGQLFGDELLLVGHSLNKTTGELELVWQNIGESSADFVTFVHLQNGDSTCCLWQADRPMLASNARPTSRWLPGEYVIDRFVIDQNIGDLPLVVGVYRPENGIRLTVTGSADDQVKLTP